ncbi:MAG: cell wall-binding repeat-containing protein [Catenulispora sp.]
MGAGGQSGPSPSGTLWLPDGQRGQYWISVGVTDAAGRTDTVTVFLYAGPRQGPPTPPPVIPPNVPPPSGAPGRATVRQIGGLDRYQTSRMVSQAQWAAGHADAVVLARGDAAPDALAGVPLAAKVHGPLLLTDPAALGRDDRAELDRVLGGPASHKTVYILGGTAAVSPGIEAELRKAGYTVQRLSGETRFDTALAVAKRFGPTSHVIVATGRNFPDALAAGPLGAVEGAPIVLSDDTTMDPATTAFVKTHTVIDAVGTQAWNATKALAGPGRSVNPLYGATRYDTATGVARRVVAMSGHPFPAGVAIAGGTAFPDALTGGAFAANAGLPLLLTDPQRLDSATADQLHVWANTLASVTIFGGRSAVTRPVADAITRTVGGTALY